MRNFDVSKVIGLDELFVKILKEIVDLIVFLFIELFNKLLRLGCLLEDWKIVNIVFLFKKNNKE